MGRIACTALCLAALAVLSQLASAVGVEKEEPEPPSWVFVKTLRGGTFGLQLDPTQSTVADLKDKIAERKKQPRDSLHLLFGGMELNEDERRLSECGLEPGSTVLVVPLDPTPRVHVRTLPGNKTFAVEIELSATVGALKERIAALEDWPRAKQRLRFDGRVLDDDKSLAELAIDETSVVYLSEPKPMVHVDAQGLKPLSFEFSPNATVKDLRAKVFKEEPLWSTIVRLIFANQQLDDDDKLLSDCGIRDQSTVRAIWVWVDIMADPLTVETDEGERLTVSISPSDTVATLKGLIWKVTGVPRDHQHLSFEGVPLEGAGQLKDYGVQAESVVKLTRQT